MINLNVVEAAVKKMHERYEEPLFLRPAALAFALQWATRYQENNPWISTSLMIGMLEYCAEVFPRRTARRKREAQKEQWAANYGWHRINGRQTIRGIRWQQLGVEPSRWVSPAVAKWLDSERCC